MLQIEQLSYSFPQKDLFHKISFSLEPGQHCALIGTSGSGKSTLLQLLLRPDDYLYDGKIQLASHTNTGYVSQFLPVDEAGSLTVFEYLSQEFIRLQSEIEKVCDQMASAEDMEPLLEQYQTLYDRFTAMDGDNYESNIRIKLNLAALGKLENQTVLSLSGGEFKLIQVIREMLTGPDFILMDEPDVFLDFANLAALKTLINSYRGTMIIITHSRYLLNHCFDKVLHLENQELQEFDGSYPDYTLSLLQYKIQQQTEASKDQQEIDRNAAIIERLRESATNLADPAKGKALKARVRLQERLLARRTDNPFVDIHQPAIQFPAAPAEEGQTMLALSDYSVAFDEVLFQNVNFEVKSGEKIALIGPNGTGKTTLLREIYRRTNPGISMDESTRLAFLSQYQGEMLTETNTILEEFQELGYDTEAQALEILTEYGFGIENLGQKVSTLSGGERNLLQLAKISTQETNLLLLDEPTSHLDTYSQLGLEEALINYPGAVLMVSHDFYSIAGCMDSVLWVEDQTLRKMSIRKFRKTIYGNYFDRDYLLSDQKRSELERKIEQALKDHDAPLALTLSEELENLA